MADAPSTAKAWARPCRRSLPCWTDVTAIDKLEFGCFGSDQFRSQLKALPGNRNTVLLCGMEAHICVMQTALGALNEGYLVHVASDAMGSRAEWNWKIGLDRMKCRGRGDLLDRDDDVRAAALLWHTAVQRAVAVSEMIRIEGTRVPHTILLLDCVGP